MAREHKKMPVRVRKLHLNIKNCPQVSQNLRERFSWYKVQISSNQIAGSKAAQAKTFWSHDMGPDRKI